MMKDLHSQRITIDDIANSLKTGPMHPSTIATIKAAYGLGCDLRIVSDANLFFIETILKHHGLFQCFSEINTNPSFVDEVGRLRILPYPDFNISSHGCGIFPPNMCKGPMVERIMASAIADGKKHFIYLGDGKGDFIDPYLLQINGKALVNEALEKIIAKTFKFSEYVVPHAYVAEEGAFHKQWTTTVINPDKDNCV